jgi:RNA polymerase sigma-70 factor (ECF subfamily)
MGNMVGAFAVQSEEAAWVKELKAGSELAYAVLLAQYQQPIYSLLSRTVQNQADAADLTQEVFLKVFRGIHSFNGEASLRTWIYRIALHEVSNSRRWWCRHQSREIPMETPVNCESNELRLKDTLVDPTRSPQEQAESTEIRERVEAALLLVPEPFRTALVLRDIEGFSYEEIVEITGSAMGTTKSRIVRGRLCLKQALVTYAAPAKQQGSTIRSENTILANTVRQGAA